MLNSDKELNCFLQMTINLMSTFITPLLSLLPVCCSLLQIEPDMTNTISYWFQSPPSIQNLVNCFSIRKSLWAVAIGNHRPLLEDTSEIHQDIQSPCRHRDGQKRLKNVWERAADTLLMEWKLDGAEKKKTTRNRRHGKVLFRKLSIVYTIPPLSCGHNGGNINRFLYQQVSPYRWLQPVTSPPLHEVCYIDHYCSWEGRGRYILWTSKR